MEARHWVRLTRACNNRCLFCLDEDARNGEVLPLAAIEEDLERGRALGLSRVVLSGGEPSVHPRFVEVVRLAARLGYTHIQAITNGRRFCYPGFLDESLKAGLSELTFSIHGHTAELHDRLTGVPGAFVQAVAGLTNALSRPGLIVSVDVVINRLNIESLEDILRFCGGLGVREFDLLQVVPFGRAWAHWELLSYDAQAFAPELRRALAAARSFGARVWTNRLAASQLEGFEDLIQPPEKLHDEARGRSAMFLDYLREGKEPDCRGERCGWCFMEGFCGDLRALRSEGRLRGRPLPACLGGGGRFRELAWKPLEPDLAVLVDFHIRSRYFVKGASCRRCRHDADCEGAPIEVVRRLGFRALRPVLGGPGG